VNNKIIVMLPIRNALFEQLFVTLNKKAIKNSSVKNDIEKTKKVFTEFMASNDSNERINKPETLSFIKLERRIDTLEKLNDQLIYFIDFLLEQLPGLINTVMIKKDHFINPGKSETEIDNTDLEYSNQEASFKSNNSPNPTPREIEVLELLIKGFCAKEIANKLFISETTVITHKKNLKEKFGARNTAELISKAYAFFVKK
jgi:DNA-binding CsgD family transcriptional regulator